MSLSTIEDGLRALARGEMVVVVDDESRENEGDIVVAGQFATSEKIAFMMKHARGLICCSITRERAEALALPLMVESNTESMKTAFTVSIDLINGVTTGISAVDRSSTVMAILDPSAKADDFARPGHIFPLIANDLGVLARQGHTEASVDLARLAGLEPVGVICEISNDDGTMARLPELRLFAREHDLHIISIADLVAYRRRNDVTVQKISECAMPTRHGEFRAISYEDKLTGVQHIALLVDRQESAGTTPLVRVHSECLTGEVFKSLRCDCGEQLELALEAISQAGRGCLIYLRGQEGRGIGLANKLKAYALQDEGFDTTQANHALGFADDGRDYLAAAGILKGLGFKTVNLLTGNPKKLRALVDCGVEIKERRSLYVASNDWNRAYMDTKATAFKQLLSSGSGG